MTAGITPAEAISKLLSASIRTSLREDVKCYLEWYGFHTDKVQALAT